MKFRIENRTCGGCARSVTKTIHSLDPAAQVEIDVPARLVDVRSSKAPTAIASALTDVGYTAVEAA